MRFPLQFTVAQYRHRRNMIRKGHRRFPTVLMLEPLYTCNLSCLGCAAERHTGKLQDRLSVAECLAASDACGAPIVNICGGEPTLYPELPDLVSRLIERGRHVLCCTNALRLKDRILNVIPPHPQFQIVVHLDGMRETHDRVAQRPGMFDTVVDAIRSAKQARYIVMINTTVYTDTSVEEVEELFRLSHELRTDGVLVSPGYEYATAQQDLFLRGDAISEKFRRIRAIARDYKVNVTPVFLDFAAGDLDLPCAPWSTVNYGPGGWRSPCYLIGERSHFDWETFWRETNWEYWERRTDPRCRNCRMHSGFEHSAVEHAMRTFGGKLKLFWWTVSK